LPSGLGRPGSRSPVSGEGGRDERVSDEARFFKAWFENPLRTGAVSPSGRYLSSAMARYVDPASKGPIIELGPGTGPVTQALLRRGVAPERLVLVEYDEAFCALLRRRFPRCHVVQGDAYDLRKTLSGVVDEPFAAVVSSLPLLNCPEPRRWRLVRQAFAMMKPDGCFVQFTYGMVSPLPLRGRTGMPDDFHGEASPPVWLNLPPARVWVYRVGAAKEARSTLEKRTRFVAALRARAARAQSEFEKRARDLRDEPALRPALALLKRLGDERKSG
jgi:phosphatidylethanolamine/phosphatidyl-N-methylethanolamine N-methyltransferase